MSEQKFKLVSSYQPTGDQPEAIDSLVKGCLLYTSDLQVTFMIHAATSFSDANGRVCVILPAEPIRRRTQRE